MKNLKKVTASSVGHSFGCKDETSEAKQKLAQKFLNKNQGFTLIELIISLAMVAIITGASLQVARFSDTHKSLTLAVDEFRAGLRTAQSSSLSIPNPDNRHVCGFGMYIRNNTTYDLFYTYAADADFVTDPNICANDISYRSYNLVDPANREIIQTSTLPTGLRFMTELGRSLFFIVPYGEIYANDGTELGGDVTFTIENTGNLSKKSITVNEFGRMQ